MTSKTYLLLSNTAQFRLISILASTKNEEGKTEHNLCVVGDDDQSIYKFRGANIYNILNFEKQYPETNVIKLEQNYRSTKNILNAANEVIQNNLGRKDKSLWTDNEEGEPIYFTQYNTEYEEAEHIVNDIYSMSMEGADYNNFAVLYRTNAQSRIFEEKFILRNIPYKIVGGVNFYQRKEIKDLLCYLKTIDNGLDDLAVKRIINVPRRGIGLTTIDRITAYAISSNLSFYDALRHAEYIPNLGRGASKITSFVSLIETLKSHLSSSDYSLEGLMNEILEATGYVKELEEEETEEAQGRIENINELINKIVSYEKTAEEEPNLSEFLEEVALVADIDNLEESNNVVVLMTLHSAKGLEFPYVYLCGMEDGIFPGYMSITSDDPTEVEEERRLCYVGITRAMKKLSLSAARQRMVRGETQFNKPSRFIREIPRYLIKESGESLTPRFASQKTNDFLGSVGKSMKTISGAMERNRAISNTVFDKEVSPSITTPFAAKPYNAMPSKQFMVTNAAPLSYGVGDRVKHMKFGIGIVIDITQGGKDYEVTVNFESSGVKKMLASFAKLTKL